MNYDLSIEKLKAKHEEEMRELLTAHEIMATLPRPPTRVLFSLQPQPWIMYSVQTLQQAVLLAEEFSNRAEYVHAKGTFTSLQPASRLKEDDNYTKYIEVQGGAPYLHLQTVDRCPSSAELVFFTTVLQDKIAKVLINIELPPARIHLTVLHESGRHGRYGGSVEVRKEYPRLYEDECIQWSSGGDTSASASYVWYSVDSYQSAISAILENDPEWSPEWRKEKAAAA